MLAVPQRVLPAGQRGSLAERRDRQLGSLRRRVEARRRRVGRRANHRRRLRARRLLLPVLINRRRARARIRRCESS